MSGARVPSFERGVRLREDADGSTMVLVPEGVVRLNGTAAAALRLVDGRRSVEVIAAMLGGASYDATPQRIAEDVAELFARLQRRRVVRWR